MHLKAPPSKAHTLRALFLGAMANGKTTIHSPLLAEDQVIAIQTLSQLGARFDIQSGKISIIGTAGRRCPSPQSLFIGNSGVCCRFLTAIAPILSKGPVHLNGTAAMQKRPLTQLLKALKPLGIDSKSETGAPPVMLKCSIFQGGSTAIEGNISSQYLSAILIASPYAQENVAIAIKGELQSKPYVAITLDLMRAFGVEAVRNGSLYRVEAGKGYCAINSLDIEGDYSSASYFLAQAALTQSEITVGNLSPESLQGDRAILDILRQFGSEVIQENDRVTVKGRPLSPITVNMQHTPDLIPTVAVTAAFAPGISEIKGINRLQYKETNRLAAIQTELEKMKIQCRIKGDTLCIKGGSPKPASINTYNDHRIAMAFAIAKRAIPKVTILNPECVNKSFPDFFKRWSAL